MDDFLKVFVLAILQGVTEFLPVSSSGHLVLAGEWLGLESPGATLEVSLHAGTLLAILWFYRRKIGLLLRGAVSRDAATCSQIGRLAFSMFPALAVYLVAGKAIERAFETAQCVGPALCVTGVVLLLARGMRRRTFRPEGSLCLQDAWVMGVAQAVALLPGISRSGTTISVACMRGVDSRTAAEFSFLMSVPLLLGATLLEAIKAFRGVGSGLPLTHLLFGAAIAGLVGFAALTLLIRMLGHGRFWIFGLYCLVLGSVATVWFWS